MRILTVFCLCAVAFAEDVPPLLAGQPIAGLSVGSGAIWARTEAGATYRITQHRVEAAEPAVPLEFRPSVTHAGFSWRATPGGIARTRLVPRFRRFDLPRATRPEENRVHALAAGLDGSLWCGTQRGLFRFRNGEFEGVRTDLGLITAVAVDRRGDVWIGSGSAFTGAYRFDGSAWERVEGIDAYVHKITLDAAGTLWFASLNAPGGDETAGRGVWTWAGDGFKHAEWLGPERVYDVTTGDPSGVLWFATLHGLVAYEGSRVTHYTPDSGKLAAEKVWCLAAASDGSLWFGYQADEGGITRLAGGAVTHFTKEQGLCGDEVWAVTEGRRGIIWVATNHGLGRYDGRRWSCFRFTDKLLWPLLPRPDGTLWIGTIGDGLWQLVPDDAAAPRTLFHVEGRGVTWSSTDAWFDTPQDELWHRVRIDGGAWSPARPGGTGSLKLAAGRHRVEVQAIDRFGNAENPPRSVLVGVDESDGPRWLGWAAAGLALIVSGWLFSRRGS